MKLQLLDVLLGLTAILSLATETPPTAQGDAHFVDTSSGRFSNPLCGLNCVTADPWIQMVGNATDHIYYWVYTSQPLQMRNASTLAGLRNATPMHIWPGKHGLWAPELHYWPSPYNSWFIYVVAVGEGIQVLRSISGQPQGPYEDKGIVTENAIDPNVLHHPNGKKYLLVKGDRMLLTELDSPWTTTGPSLELPLLKCTRPGKEQWYEAPATWVRADMIWLMYSRCNTGPDYELMLAYCNAAEDVMNEACWHHFSEGPVIVGNGGDDRGPGHNGWFSSPDGTQTWIVYHGTAVNETGRSSRVMQIPFDESGWPHIPQPPPIKEYLTEPSSSSAAPLHGFTSEALV